MCVCVCVTVFIYHMCGWLDTCLATIIQDLNWVKSNAASLWLTTVRPGGRSKASFLQCALLFFLQQFCIISHATTMSALRFMLPNGMSRLLQVVWIGGQLTSSAMLFFPDGKRLQSSSPRRWTVWLLLYVSAMGKTLCSICTWQKWNRNELHWTMVKQLKPVKVVSLMWYNMAD